MRLAKPRASLPMRRARPPEAWPRGWTRITAQSTRRATSRHIAATVLISRVVVLVALVRFDERVHDKQAHALGPHALSQRVDVGEPDHRAFARRLSDDERALGAGIEAELGQRRSAGATPHRSMIAFSRRRSSTLSSSLFQTHALTGSWMVYPTISLRPVIAATPSATPSVLFPAPGGATSTVSCPRIANEPTIHRLRGIMAACDPSSIIS